MSKASWRRPFRSRRSSSPALKPLRLLFLLYGAAPHSTGLHGEPIPAPIVLTQVPVDAGPPSDWKPESFVRADWFAASRVVVRSADGSVRVLSKGFHSACDPDVSCDGQRVLFAGKKEPGSPWSIWEIGVDGNSARSVSSLTRDCRSPIYAGPLFTLNAAAPWQTIIFVGRNAALNENGRGPSTSLYAANLDGSGAKRITFNASSDFDPFQTFGGRILYAGWRYAAVSPWRISLFGVHLDGTDHELYGAVQGRRFQHMPCVTKEGLVVFVESDSAAWDGAGALACITQRRPHHSYRALTEEEPFCYSYPSPVTGKALLVSRRSATGEANYSICRFDAGTGQSVVVLDTKEFHEVQPKLMQPRPKPDGRSTVVMPKFSTGTLYGLNCYDTRLPMRRHLSPGSIRRLRVIEGVPAGSASSPRSGPEAPAPRAARRLLGEAPVERDGSFNVEIPCDTPVELQVLDERGMALATCRWVWVRPKEKRGCIGCHEDPERIPENSFVLANRRPSNLLTLPPDKRRSVGFREHVLPIIRAKCSTMACHGGAETPLRLIAGDGPASKGAKAAYTALLAPGEAPSADEVGSRPSGRYVDVGRARTSALVWHLFGESTAKPWDRRGGVPVAKMPPPDTGVALTEDEMRTFVEWIDLGASWETFETPARQPGPAEPVKP